MEGIFWNVKKDPVGIWIFCSSLGGRNRESVLYKNGPVGIKIQSKRGLSESNFRGERDLSESDFRAKGTRTGKMPSIGGCG